MMKKSLLDTFNRYTDMKVSGIHLKKKNDFVKDLISFMRLNRNTLNRHFNEAVRTSQNPVYKVDSLVWSTVFFEKVDRYAPVIYLMGEYLIKNQQAMKKLSLKDLEKGLMNFDIFRISLDYREKILAVNPQLTQDEFEAELDNDEQVKKFFYTYDDPDYVMPIEVEKENVIDHRMDHLLRKMDRVRKKFKTHDSYDYFEELEEGERERKEREEKYIWRKKRDRDLAMFVSGEEQIREIRRRMREESSGQLQGEQ